MANPFLTLGGIAVGVAMAALGIVQVPGWIASAQHAAAVNDIQHVKTAQASAELAGYGYQSGSELPVYAERAGLTVVASSGVTVCVTVSADRGAYAAVAISETGRYVAEVGSGKTGEGATATAALTDAGGLPAGVPVPVTTDGCVAGAGLPGN